MYKEVNENDFIDEMRDSFSTEWASTLFDYLEWLDPNYNLDTAEIRGDYTEYKDLEEYNIDNYRGNPWNYIEKWELEHNNSILWINEDSFIVCY